MRDRPHLIKRINLFKSELLCLFHCVLNIGSQMLLPMAVTSDRQDPPAELSIQAQNIDRRRQVLKSIAMTGGIDLYALAVRPRWKSWVQNSLSST